MALPTNFKDPDDVNWALKETKFKIHADKQEPKELERIPLSKWDNKFKNGAAEGLEKKMNYWQTKDLDISIAQSINLAQNQVLNEPIVGDDGIVLNRIKELHPKYLKLLLEAKEEYNPKDNKEPF